MYYELYARVILLIIPVIYCQKKDLSKTEALYASSLFRRNQILEGVTQIETLENVSSVSICLLNCMKRKPDCKSFNWGNGECLLMSDSLCVNESLHLTSKEGYAYYDIMDTPDFEKKNLKDVYCSRFGKCSGRCYPRKPHYIDTPMTKKEAFAVCEKLGRSLPQPRSNDDNAFYVNFIRQLLEDKPEIRNHKDMKVFWMGLTDAESEGIWMYDDNTPVSDSFTAWALGQPDNGGPFAKSKENCGVVGEKGDFKWFDVNCRIKLKFFCA